MAVPQALVMKRMREVMCEIFTGRSADTVTEGELRRIHSMTWEFPTVLPEEDGGDVGHRLEVPHDMNMPIVLISSVSSDGAAGTGEGAAGTGEELDDDDRAVKMAIRHLFTNAAAPAETAPAAPTETETAPTETVQTSGAAGTSGTTGFTAFQGVGMKLSGEPVEQPIVEQPTTEMRTC